MKRKKHPLSKIVRDNSSGKRRKAAAKDIGVPDVVTPAGGEPERVSVLKEETSQWEFERRLAEQAGERSLGVKVQEAREVKEPDQEETPQDRIGLEEHPNLISQLFDGASDDMTISPADLDKLPPEQRMEAENQLRLEQQLKQQKQQQLQHSTAPTPSIGG